MQGHECSKGMSKSKTGLQSLSQDSWERVWNREGRAGSGMQSSENRIKVGLDGIRGRRSWNKFGSWRSVDRSSGAVLHRVYHLCAMPLQHIVLNFKRLEQG